MVICPICGVEFKQLTKRHLENHHTTIQEFRVKFPNTLLGNSASGFKASLELRRQRSEKKATLYALCPSTCFYCGGLISYKQFCALKVVTRSLKEKIFCSRNCAACVNNKNRVVSLRTKDKIRNSLQRHFSIKEKANPSAPKSSIFYNHCSVCDKHFISSYKKKTCSKKCLSVRLQSSAFDRELGGNFNPQRSLWYTSPSAGKVHLESSWEVTLAEIFDKNNVRWCRPAYLPWVDESGVAHNYYPDFFSFTHNIFIDPKNKYVLQGDKFKLNYVVKKYGITLLIISDPELLTLATVEKASNKKGLILV